MSTPIRVVVIDSQTLTRFGLFVLFTRQSDIKFVEDTTSGANGHRLVATHRPDVVTVDVALPDGDGLTLTRELRDRYPHLGIVVLSSTGNDEALFGALESGASAFVAKNAQTGEVLGAVRHAAVAATSFTAAGLALAMARRQRSDDRPTLSAREREVLTLLGHGLSIPDIARSLYVSHSTAKTYTARIYEKLSATNRAQAVMTALRMGLIRSDEAPRFEPAS